MKNMTIVDRVVERLKLQPVGDLITEEDLHEIVKTAIPKVFFEPQLKEIGDTSWNRRTVHEDPKIVQVMRELLTEHARTYVKEWIGENEQLLADHWRKVFDNGIMTYALKVQEEMLTAHIKSAVNAMVSTLNNERSGTGQTMLGMVS